jgi:hypothetical protein
MRFLRSVAGVMERVKIIHEEITIGLYIQMNIDRPVLS